MSEIEVAVRYVNYYTKRTGGLPKGLKSAFEIDFACISTIKIDTATLDGKTHIEMHILTPTVKHYEILLFATSGPSARIHIRTHSHVI